MTKQITHRYIARSALSQMKTAQMLAALCIDYMEQGEWDKLADEIRTLEAYLRSERAGLLRLYNSLPGEVTSD